ncbi:MAG: lysophospholipid acyltransferase family protein [Marivibrio sp.]|uniref:lysophospholipid acyltransferase family protein n=1 Tax=Marivibrio sp. TaxID=2039719 RepID=UPI0032EE3F7E
MTVKAARPMDRVRSIVFALTFYPLTTAMLILLLPTLLLPIRWARPVCYLWVDFFDWMSRRVLRVRYRIQIDREASDAIARGPVIFAAKHQSMWETLIFNALLNRPAFVLKEELTRIPLFGRFLKKFEMVAVDRTAGAAALKGMVRQARDQIEKGRSVVIYPQGTRVAPGEKRPYLPGAAALYSQIDAPVIPIALDSGRLWPRRAFVKRAGTITVKVLAPIPKGLDRKSFLQMLKARIEQACG